MSGGGSQGTVIYKCAFGHYGDEKVYFGCDSFRITLIWEEREPWIGYEDRKFGTRSVCVCVKDESVCLV